MMLVAVDVGYDDQHDVAKAAAVVFHDWRDASPAAERVVHVRRLQPYIPGQFYRRELPCLLAVLHEITAPYSTVIVDGYVNLGDKPGLGEHLHHAIKENSHQEKTVIGVAKTRFHRAHAVEVIRNGAAPLYITALGVNVQQAADNILHMHGPYRIPTLLRRVDGLSRLPRTNG